ncbi:hypothetical protein PITCH_A950017 [uncultured Desulfobacterium sp.]|uniref:Uncharacterized protein n=1 Tax=uncultured Desulfobacterium sp. TaxID=201089 RepID=A0A445N447_9BACT|nr:hypothetical protein PITCH_A950017 [uncultured Desulfobacterium sp.]
MTIQALALLLDLWWVVTLFIKAGGEPKYVPWAKFNTIATPLAPIINDVYHTLFYLNVIGIKRSSPICHSQTRTIYKVLVNYQPSLGWNIAILDGKMSRKKYPRQ